jgi:hypothetical protein
VPILLLVCRWFPQSSRKAENAPQLGPRTEITHEFGLMRCRRKSINQAAVGARRPVVAARRRTRSSSLLDIHRARARRRRCRCVARLASSREVAREYTSHDEGRMRFRDAGAGTHADALEQLIDGRFGGHVSRFEHFNRMLEFLCHGDELPVAPFRRDHQMQQAIRTRHADPV